MSRKTYDDDDGRTIADMSNLESRSLTSAFQDARKQRQEAKEALRNNPQLAEDKKTRKLYMFGALRAGLLIGLVYIAAFAILIIILLLIWHAL